MSIFHLRAPSLRKKLQAQLAEAEAAAAGLIEKDEKKEKKVLEVKKNHGKQKIKTVISDKKN